MEINQKKELMYPFNTWGLSKTTIIEMQKILLRSNIKGKINFISNECASLANFLSENYQSDKLHPYTIRIVIEENSDLVKSANTLLEPFHIANIEELIKMDKELENIYIKLVQNRVLIGESVGIEYKMKVK